MLYTKSIEMCHKACQFKIKGDSSLLSYTKTLSLIKAAKMCDGWCNGVLFIIATYIPSLQMFSLSSAGHTHSMIVLPQNGLGHSLAPVELKAAVPSPK